MSAAKKDEKRCAGCGAGLAGRQGPARYCQPCSADRLDAHKRAQQKKRDAVRLAKRAAARSERETKP